MKLPDKFYPSLILLFLAILSACLLSFFVLRPPAATKADLSNVLIRGPSINEGANYSPLFALLAAFAMVRGYKYWRTINHSRLLQAFNNPKEIPGDVKNYKDALKALSSLKTKSDPPKFVKRKKRILKNRRKSTRFSSKQTGKIINFSRSLSEFMTAE